MDKTRPDTAEDETEQNADGDGRDAGYSIEELTEIRHWLHQHPERSFHETGTTAYLKGKMGELGIPVLDVPGLETGLVARIKGQDEGPHIMLRADIDALPVTESTDLPYRSQNEGVMHACGHDFHMTYLLGAASRLAARAARGELPGTVDILFQPSEETGEGALHVMKTGVIDGLDAIIGAHNMPDYKPGEVAVGTDPMMACCIHFGVTIHAAGAHGSRPDTGTDPIAAMAAMITSLQTIVSRNINPLHPAVLSVTCVKAGDVWNVIPAQASFIGTARVFTDEDRALIHDRFYTIVESTAAAYGVSADIDWPRSQPVMVSDPILGAAVADDVRNGDYARLAPIVPQMPGEDFAEYGAKTRMVFGFIGTNGGVNGDEPHYIHSPQYVGLDESIPAGVGFYEHAALRVLSEIAAGN